MRTLWRDLRYGARGLWNNPGFTAVAVFTLALGIAANTTVFSWMDTVLLRPLPGVAGGDRLVVFETIQPSGEGRNTSWLDYRDYRDNLKLISGLALGLQPNSFSLGEGERAERVWGELVSGNYFDVLGVKPFLGRFFSPEEQGDKPGAYPVVVIGHRLWSNRFNSDRGVVGRTVRVNRRELTIVGVAPPEFRGMARGLLFEMWAPLMMGPQLNLVAQTTLDNRRSRGINAMARLRPGTPIEQARAEVASVARRLAAAYPDTNQGFGATLVREENSLGSARNRLRAPLRILLAMCFVVLLIACVNVANLLLARAIARQKEFSIRLALGAGRVRLARQLLTEALLLAGLGAVTGVPLAMWLADGLPYLVPRLIGTPVGLDFRVSGAALGFTILVCGAASLLAGISPALYAARRNVNEGLKENGRSGTSGTRSHALRNLSVVSEVALALVALVGAGLFAKSFRNSRAIHPGFDAQNVTVSRFYLSAAGYTGDRQKQFCAQLRERLEAAPGVSAASYADTIPLGFGLGPGAGLEIEGYLPARSEDMVVSRTLVAPGYFGLMRIPLLNGRDFTARDDANAPPVMIVNQAFARRFFAGRDPVGRKVRAFGKWLTVAGLVQDSKYYDVTEKPRPFFYAPFQQFGASLQGLGVAFYVRAAGDSGRALLALRREAAAIDPAAAAFDAVPLTEYIEAPLFPQRIAAILLTALGALSLLLTAVGLYSVMAYTVSQRMHEFGIRMALGVQRPKLLAMVIRHGMVLTGTGLAAGIVAALAAARLIQGLLTGVGAADPMVFAGASLFLGAVALAASCLPARRATRVDPVVALRQP
ncbi:MAG: ABC transporter permease [Acidobacteria bacterium]|nr:ABC transporter permease [Acidobacteriota bacterium]